MKKDIHPKNYRPVVFRDTNVDKSWIMNSVVETTETVTWEDGKEYPLFELAISAYSHPFYTGKSKVVDSEGRVDKFKKRYQMQ